MSRIDKMNREIRWEQPEKIEQKAHPDYDSNLKQSEVLCKNFEKHTLNGVNVKICDSEHLNKALLIISWSPGNAVKRGNYATPIFLHQYSNDFKKTAQTVLNFYLKTVQEHESKNPKQSEFLPPDQKV